MSRFTIFVGGIHGSGKGVFCHSMQQEVICDYISASHLLHWATKDKTVEDVGANQDLLSVMLPQALRDDKTFIVDGHYSLLNKKSGIEKVGLNLFDAIKPNILIVVVEDPAVIAERLQKRDQFIYKVEEIEKHQSIEIDNAKYISEKLQIPIYMVKSSDAKGVKDVIFEIKGMMTEYTRENIYSEMLKTVIMRFDYSGGTGIFRFIDTLKQEAFIREAFASLNRIEAPRNRYEAVRRESEPGFLPINEKQRDILFRFSECKYDKGLNVILDITPESVCLSIDCRANYNGSQRYTDFMCKLITLLKNYDPYISIERIGVRKIDVQLAAAPDRLEHYFSENFLALQSWRKSVKNKVNYVDFFRIDGVNFNVAQCIDRVKIVNEKKEEVVADRAIYDVDAYIINGDINRLTGDEQLLAHFLNTQMQDKMFELFVSVASKEYLEKCKNAKLHQNG